MYLGRLRESHSIQGTVWYSLVKHACLLSLFCIRACLIFSEGRNIVYWMHPVSNIKIADITLYTLIVHIAFSLAHCVWWNLLNVKQFLLAEEWRWHLFWSNNSQWVLQFKKRLTRQHASFFLRKVFRFRYYSFIMWISTLSFFHNAHFQCLKQNKLNMRRRSKSYILAYS